MPVEPVIEKMDNRAPEIDSMYPFVMMLYSKNINSYLNEILFSYWC